MRNVKNRDVIPIGQKIEPSPFLLLLNIVKCGDATPNSMIKNDSLDFSCVIFHNLV